MRSRPVPSLLLLVLLAAALVTAGCGGSGSGSDDKQGSDGPPVLGTATATSDSGDGGGKPADEHPAAQLGFPGFATRNTTRVAGADPVADAAGVALAVYPGQAADSRPAAVTLADAGDWRTAVSAAQLAARPLRAPVLLARGGKVPAVTQDALATLRPIGAPKASGAQVVRAGDAAPAPRGGLKAITTAGATPARAARAIDDLQAKLAGRRTRQVIVAGTGAPAYAMPAAALAARSGAPVLWATGDTVPAATAAAIRARKAPRIYVVGPASAVSAKAVVRLRRLGTVTRIDGADPVTNAIAVARFGDGSFGWNVVDPGHGLVIASQDRPADAAAGAVLSSTGTYGPLLLVTEAGSLPAALQGYLLDIQPGYDKDPARGVYNHAWLLGADDVVSVPVQARIDSLLEIQPVDRSR